MSKLHKVLLVGHCGPDSYMLKSKVQQILPEVSVLMNNDESALEQETSTSLLLVNRVLDGRFASDSGIDLIRRLSSRPDAPAMMLISNYEDAQQQAVAAGAREGFGKAQLGDPRTSALLQEVADDAH